MVNPINSIALPWNGQKPSLRIQALRTTPPSTLMASGNSTKTGPILELEFRFFRISMDFLNIFHQLADRPSHTSAAMSLPFGATRWLGDFGRLEIRSVIFCHKKWVRKSDGTQKDHLGYITIL